MLCYVRRVACNQRVRIAILCYVRRVACNQSVRLDILCMILKKINSVYFRKAHGSIKSLSILNGEGMRCL